jgi:hypothetical protein
MSLVILFLMMVVLVWSFCASFRCPEVPIEPDTLVGLMYLVYDSEMLYDFVGMGRANREEWKRQLGKGGDKYRIGEMTGLSGVKRVGVYREEGVS